MTSSGDQIRWRATTIVVLSVAFFFVVQRAHAEIDLSLGASARSYPLSGVVEADAGYDFLLWGSHGGDSPWYGYVRPNVSASSSGTYNSGLVALDIFPLAFVGLTVGGELIQNDQDYTAYDCGAESCRGRFHRNFLQGEIDLGYGPIFAQARWRREHWRQAHANTIDFVEPTAGLALMGQGDDENIVRGLLGYKWSTEWSAIASFTNTESDRRHGLSQFSAGFARYTQGAFSVGFGGGLFSSSLKMQDLSLVGFFTWQIKPSFALN